MDYQKLFTNLIHIKEHDPEVVYHPAELTKEIRHVLCEFGFKTLTIYNKIAEFNHVTASASYTPQHELFGKNPITVNIMYCPGQYELKIRDVDWVWTCSVICSVVGHELMHQNQWRKRDFVTGFEFRGDGSRSQQYLGEPDEIEAYGFCIALQRILMANNGREVPPMEHDSYYAMYASTFYEGHYILNLLNKQINKYYKQLTRKGGLNVIYRPRRCGQ